MDAVPFHIGIATDDLPTSMAAIGGALGVDWTTPSRGAGSFTDVHGHEQRRPQSCISLGSAVHIDLVQGDPGTLWLVETPRLHHLAYWTDDLPGDVERLGEQGWQLELSATDERGTPTVFAYLIRDDGFRIELIDAAGKDAYEARLSR